MELKNEINEFEHEVTNTYCCYIYKALDNRTILAIKSE